MEVKKAPIADLEGKKTTWLLVGFIFILSIMFVAFEWTRRDVIETGEIIEVAMINFEEEIIPITMQEKPVAPVPVEAKQISETIEIVEDDAEIEETIKSCIHAVQQTIEVFLRRIDEFNTKMFFIKHFGFPLSDLSKTKPQLAAKILGGNYKGKMFDDEFQFPILDCLAF